MKTKSNTNGKVNPFAVAREAVEEAYGDEIGELHYTIQNELKAGTLDKLFAAINPRIKDIDKEITETEEQAERDGQGKLAGKLQSLWSSRELTWMDASFVLGIAFAQRLSGDRLAPVPPIDATPKEKQPKDRIDALVDNLDKYYFRMGSAEMMLGGSTWGEMEDYVDNVRQLFETAGAKEAKELFYQNAREAEAKTPGILRALEDAAFSWQAQEETFTTLLGYIIGLRVAGIPSEQAKRMARTWRLGYPQDDSEKNSATPRIINDPAEWGGCPKCHRNDGYLNAEDGAGMGHWFYCKRHKLKWHVGTNLFSGWSHATKEELLRQTDVLAECQEVEAWHGAPKGKAAKFMSASRKETRP